MMFSKQAREGGAASAIRWMVAGEGAPPWAVGGKLGASFDHHERVLTEMKDCEFNLRTRVVTLTYLHSHNVL